MSSCPFPTTIIITQRASQRVDCYHSADHALGYFVLVRKSKLKRQKILEEGCSIQRPKHCEYNNQVGDNNLHRVRDISNNL